MEILTVTREISHNEASRKRPSFCPRGGGNGMGRSYPRGRDGTESKQRVYETDICTYRPHIGTLIFLFFVARLIPALAERAGRPAALR